MAYSSLFTVVHDEQQPVGDIGRGSHYSVFSCPQWTDRFMQPYASGQACIQKFAVIWDEDHDDRVISVLEKAYIQGVLAPVKFIGERKGSLTIIVDAVFWVKSNQREFVKAWEKLAGDVADDWWSAEVSPENERSGLISDTDDKVATYLKNISNLWAIGSAPFKEKPRTISPWRADEIPLPPSMT